jgi:uroporphyrinogen-III synthase
MGKRVLVLESRRAREMGSLVTSYAGQPIVAPSMREVPLESNLDAVAFAKRLIAGELDLVILLTGVGARAILEVVDRVLQQRADFVAALGRTKVAVRGPKPMAVLRELGVPAWVTAREPNTWRDLLAALDAKASELSLRGLRVAVQEYGASNPDLLEGLRSRGADVTAVPVYQWGLPEDLAPLQAAIRSLVADDVDVVLFTTATQAVHLMQVAGSMHLAGMVREKLKSVVVASIGPTTSEELRQQGLAIDLEPSHPKMGFLVREAAERADALLEAKRGPKA